MEPVFKLLLFFVFFFAISIGGYKAYTFFNKKIKASQTGWQLLALSLLLIVVNIILFFGGLLAFFTVYNFLKTE